MCYPAERDRSWSNGTSVIKEIRLKTDPSRPAFEGHSRSSELAQIDPPLLLKFHSNNGPISYHIVPVIAVENQKISPCTPVYLTPLIKGFPLELVRLSLSKKLEWWATGPRKKFDDIFSGLDTIHERDWRTDSRTPDDSKDRAYT